MRQQAKSSQAGSMDLILIIVLIVILVGGVGYYVYQRYNKPSTSVSPNSKTSSTMAMMHPGVVQLLQFGTDLDPKNNTIKTPNTIFKQTDGTIYVAAMLKNAKKGTRIEYVRYRDDFMVDNGGVTIQKDGTKTVSFAFGLKTGGIHPKGTYKVKLYANGIFETSGAYTIQ